MLSFENTFQRLKPNCNNFRLPVKAALSVAIPVKRISFSEQRLRTEQQATSPRPA